MFESFVIEIESLTMLFCVILQAKQKLRIQKNHEISSFTNLKQE